jgi:hypothetical protein
MRCCVTGVSHASAHSCGCRVSLVVSVDVKKAQKKCLWSCKAISVTGSAKQESAGSCGTEFLGGRDRLERVLDIVEPL